MAEPLIYDDTPLDQYLRDAGTDEQALHELSARLPPTSGAQSYPVKEPTAPAKQPLRHTLSLIINQLVMSLQTKQPPPPRPARTRPVRKANSSFAERFKFAICASFLLTSSLSISFYNSEPTATAPEQIESEDDGESPAVYFAEPQPFKVAGPVTVRDRSPLIEIELGSRRAPGLTGLSIFFLAFLSPSWTSWFKISLAILCITWTGILLLNLGQQQENILFHLTHRARPERFLLESRPSFGLSAQEKRYVQSQAVKQARKLVKAAQNYDVAVNKSIGAVQEVELVSRGFKLTQPLPPISRIEAASWSSSPSRQPPSAWIQVSRLSRSSSTGGSAASNRKQGQRPLSLSLSQGRASPIGGRESPSLSYESHDDPQPSRRLASIRQQLLDSFDVITSQCKQASTTLEEVADKEELNLLKEMYALEVAPPPTEPSYLEGGVMTTPKSKHQSIDFSTSSVGHKRLSLLSDGVPAYDRSSSSASKRDSNNFDGTYRSPRFNYVTEKSGGPNESAASKRLSYISTSSAASVGPKSPQRMSILGTNSIFNPPEEPAVLDPQTLLGLKNRFEQAHLARRRAMCFLLALDFSLAQDEAEEYWNRACGVMERLIGLFDEQSKQVTEALSREMGPTRTEEPTGLTGHPGLEDRFATMALSLRSIQAKLVCCSEEIGVKPPPSLHGSSSVPFENSELERIFDSIRDDLFSLSAEWESGLKILKKTSPSPARQESPFKLTHVNVERDLSSPLEEDEDLASGTCMFGDEEDEDDNDLAELLLRSTEPSYLPPPGLEQVFESIAEFARETRSTLTREERIRIAKSKREEDKKVKGMDQMGMVSELSQVIRERKVKRDPQEQQLGSPLDLDRGHPAFTGMFAPPTPESSHNLSEMPFDLGAQVAAYARRRAALTQS